MISIIGIVVALIIIGVAMYLVDLIPMDATIKRILQIVVILVVVLWVLEALGIIVSLGTYGMMGNFVIR